MRPLRARLVTSHSGGSGTPLGRHYGRSARSSLHWPARMPVQETRPGADGGTHRERDACKCRDGALRGERRRAWTRRATLARASRASRMVRLSALHPLGFSAGRYDPHNSDDSRRENEGACPDDRTRTTRGRRAMSRPLQAATSPTSAGGAGDFQHALKFWRACPNKRCRRERSLLGRRSVAVPRDLLAGGAGGGQGVVARDVRCQARQPHRAAGRPPGRAAARWPKRAARCRIEAAEDSDAPEHQCLTTGLAKSRRSVASHK